MRITRTPLAFSLAALLALGACGGEDAPQTLPPSAAPGADAMGQDMDPEMMALIGELQELQQQLGPIQDQVMQDPELQRHLEEVRDQVDQAMRADNPELLDRMSSLEAEFVAAQEAEDQARMQELGMQAQAMEMELRQAQEAVLSRPDIQERIEAFEAEQRAKMLEIDPEAGSMMDRMDEIVERLGW